MADTKISALTAATTPLAGTEVLPIVQSGTTKQVSVANLTAGRAVSGLTFTSTVATGTAPFTVTSTTQVANLNAATAGTASNLLSNATTGVMQIVGPGAGTTRVMTIPNANFTAARTDAAQTFTGNQAFNNYVGIGTSASANFPLIVEVNTTYNAFFSNPNATGYGPLIRAGSTSGSNSLSVQTYDGGLSLFSVRGDGELFWYNGNINQSTANKGIQFGNNATAAGKTSTLLNWYEEGTFTPAITGETTNPTVSYSTQQGYYTRVGRVVTINIRMTLSAYSGGSGNVLISGLPFAASGTGSPFSMYMELSNVTFGAGYTSVSYRPLTGQTYGRFNAVGSGVATAALTVSALTSTSDIIVSGVYLV